jgi:hypothetical protein
MRYWRLALVALLCCMTMRESVALVAYRLEDLISNQSDQHVLPSQDSEMPAPTEGDEAEWLTADWAEENGGLVVLLAEAKSLTRVHRSFHTGRFYSTSRELFDALHRLRL